VRLVWVASNPPAETYTSEAGNAEQP
jgi:hypothetical protein